MEANIRNILENKKDSEKTALISSYEQITYQQLYLFCKSTADALKNICVCGNAAIYLPNCINYVKAYFICSFLEKTIVPLPITATFTELQYTIQYCDVNIIFTEEQYLDQIRGVGNTYLFFCVDTGRYVGNVHGCDAAEQDVFLLLHTSGTTSRPKRVMLTHRNLLENAKAVVKSLGLREDDIAMVVLPFFLATGNMQLIQHIMMGNTIVIYDGIFIPARVLALATRHRVSVLTCVTFMLKAFLRIEHEDMFQKIRIIAAGAGIVPADVIQSFTDRFPHICFAELYGTTEASPRITQLVGEDAVLNPSSIGKPIDGVYVKVVNNANQACKAYEKGEITVSGPNLMKGYYKRPDQTAQVIRDGWLFTGDLGYFDDDGFLYLVGRKKNVIISSGYNIYPEEIEEVLGQHPKILEAMIYGIPDDLYGEIVGAKIVSAEPMTVNEVLQYLKLRLQPIKHPKTISFVERLERTPNGKIIRRS